MKTDTDNVLVVVDPNNNQLKRDDDVGKEDMNDNRGWRQRCIATMVQRIGRSATMILQADGGRGSSPSLPANSFIFWGETYFFEASKKPKKQTDAEQRDALF